MSPTSAMNNPLPTLAMVTIVASLALLGTGCGRSGEGEFPKRAPRVDDWPAIPYRTQSPDTHSRTRGEGDARVGEIEGLLAARYGEPFIVISVSDETYSAPGWPGGAAGRYLAYPEADPSLLFGGRLGVDLVDNYVCIRAAAPFAAWHEREQDTRITALAHECERSANMPSRAQLWVFDDSGRSPQEIAEELQQTLAEPLRAASEHAFEALSVVISIHPPGAGPIVRQVLSTTRRAGPVRNSLRHRERDASVLRWKLGAWSLSAEPPQRAAQVEAQILTTVAPLAPAGVSLEVRCNGKPGASLNDLTRHANKRQAVHVHVRVDGSHDAQRLADWMFAAQIAVDPRVLLYWDVSLCDAGAGVP